MYLLDILNRWNSRSQIILVILGFIDVIEEKNIQDIYFNLELALLGFYSAVESSMSINQSDSGRARV